MSDCPVCRSEGKHGVLVATSDGFLQCANCDYRRGVVEKIPSQAELVKLLAECRERLAKYETKD